jgi:hypothetical protein
LNNNNRTNSQERNTADHSTHTNGEHAQLVSHGSDNKSLPFFVLEDPVVEAFEPNIQHFDNFGRIIELPSNRLDDPSINGIIPNSTQNDLDVTKSPSNIVVLPLVHMFNPNLSSVNIQTENYDEFSRVPSNRLDNPSINGFIPNLLDLSYSIQNGIDTTRNPSNLLANPAVLNPDLLNINSQSENNLSPMMSLNRLDVSLLNEINPSSFSEYHPNRDANAGQILTTHLLESCINRTLTSLKMLIYLCKTNLYIFFVFRYNLLKFLKNFQNSYQKHVMQLSSINSNSRYLGRLAFILTIIEKINNISNILFLLLIAFIFLITRINR